MDQIKRKVQKLKKSFRDAKSKNNTSGQSRHDPPHMRKLQELFGTRPSVTRLPGIGLDMSDAVAVVAQSPDSEGKNLLGIATPLCK